MKKQGIRVNAPKRKVWLAVDINGEVYVYDSKPKRGRLAWFNGGNSVRMPMWAAERIVGRILKWEDRAVGLEMEGGIEDFGEFFKGKEWDEEVEVDLE